MARKHPARGSHRGALRVLDRLLVTSPDNNLSVAIDNVVVKKQSRGFNVEDKVVSLRLNSRVAACVHLGP